MSQPIAAPAVTAWSPLRHAVFRMLWAAWLTANVSLWMNDVAAAWLMTTLTADPVLVALVQTATALPVFLLAVPGGAVADIVDRRRMLLATQLWVAATATLLALAAATGTLSAPALLVLVFAHGIGLAMRWPVFSAVVPDVVPKPELPQAMALNALAGHMARVVGPVVAGALLAWSGSAAVFALNALLSLTAATVIWRWRHAPRVSQLPGERVLGAMRVGLRYVWLSRPLRAALLRGFVFFLQTTALLALLPLLAKGLPGGGAGTYTLLLSCMGVGAVLVATAMPRLRARLQPGQLLTGGTVLFAVSTTVAAVAPNVMTTSLAMLPAGAAWIAAGNSLTLSAQLALPDWVRARGMAFFLMAVMGGSAAGAALWGALAGFAGVRNSLLVASSLAIVMLAVLRRAPLVDDSADDDLVPHHVESQPVAKPIAPDAGPVMVTVEYIVDPRDEIAFVELMEETRRARLRGGALSWTLMRDASDASRHLEVYLDENWVEHQRRIERLTAADARLRQQRLALHRGTQPPRVTRHVAQDRVR